MAFGNGSDDPDGPDALALPRRRDLLRVLGVTGVAGLAGCAGGDESGTQSPGDGAGGTATSGGGDETATGTPTATPEPSARQVGGEWTSGDATDAESLFWIQVADSPSSARVGLTLDGAYAVTTDQEVFPLWLDITSDDKRVYECTLRDGLQWSDPYGQMTAEDWVYMITEVFQAEDNWAGFVSQGDWQRNGEFIPVERTGKLSFEIQLPEVDPAFPLKPVMWGQYCLPKGLIEKYAPDKDVEGFKQDEEIQTLAYAGNLGPYVFERWDRESAFSATRNPDYYMHDADVPERWREAPYFDRYTIKVIPEESTRLAALRTGEITSSGVPSTKVTQFEGLDSVDVVQAPQPFNSLLIYNQRANGWRPFREKAVRRALSWAVNKEAVVESILRGYADVAHTFQPKWSKWYDDSLVEETGVGESYDPEEARSRLESALPPGWEYDGDELVGSGGDPVSLKLVYPIGTETTKTTCEFIAQEYGRIGIDVQVKGVQFNTLLQKYVQNSAGGDSEWNSGPFNGGNRNESTSEESWDMQYGIIFNTYPRTPTSTRPFWTKDGSVNYFGYVPSVNARALYDTASRAVDDGVRRDALAKVFGALSDDQPCNFMNFGVSITGYQDEVAGYTKPAEFGYGWDSRTWYFDR